MTRIMKTVLWISGIVLLLGALAYPKIKPLMFESSNNPAVSANPGGSIPARSRPASLQVSTFLVEPTSFTETITSTGTIRADEGIDLQAETNGRVVSINFVEGTPVRQGDLLVKLNDAELLANLNRYKESKRLAELRYRRFAQLRSQQVVTQDDYDAALSEVQIQQSFIDLYQAQIDRTEIRAPFDGVVGLRYVSVGAFVTASTKIATLQRVDSIKIDFSVPERYSSRIKVGSHIRFSVAGALEQHTGTVYAIDPQIDPSTRTLMVRAITPDNKNNLFPGAFTHVSLELEELPNAYFIPAEAVIPGLEEKNVFVIEDGVAVSRAVETGSRTATLVQILFGLQAGDQVITSGLQQIRSNQPVEPIFLPHSAKDVKVETRPQTLKEDDPPAHKQPRKAPYLADTVDPNRAVGL